MAFFDNLKLIRKKTQYSITYKDKLLLSVKPEVLGLIIKDYSTQKFLKELSKLIKSKDIDNEFISEGMLLVSAYTTRKKRYYRNTKITKIKNSDKEFLHFIKASKLIKKHQVSPKLFLDAQIKGMAFLNEGAGIFPKPSQLATSGAEDRLIQHMANEGLTDTGETAINRIKITRDDKETALMENPKFVEYYEKMEDGSANLVEAYFIHDCMLARKGRVTKMVDEYIEKLKDRSKIDE